MRLTIYSQNGIDLPYELHTDIQGSFCDNTTKLEVIWKVVIFRSGSAEETLVGLSLV
jgi:hypothetical protein